MQTAHAAHGARISAWRTLAAIVRDEGAAALLRGVAPAVVRACTYGALRFGSYEPIKSAIGGGGGISPFRVKLAAGCASGALAALITNPIEVWKVRAQTSNLGSAAPISWRTEGVAALMRGVQASMLRSALLTAGQMSCYDEIKHQLRARLALPDAISLHLAAAFVCGLVTTTITAPVDVVKTRLMTSAPAMAYRGTWHCATTIVRCEGAAALFRGWLPSYARQGPATVIILTLNEALRRAAGMSAL